MRPRSKFRYPSGQERTEADLCSAPLGTDSYWAKGTSIGFKTINAMSETAAEKPAFRDAMKLRRCLIPANGFYEWLRREVT